MRFVCSRCKTVLHDTMKEPSGNVGRFCEECSVILMKESKEHAGGIWLPEEEQALRKRVRKRLVEEFAHYSSTES